MNRKLKQPAGTSQRILKSLLTFVRDHFVPHPGNRHVPRVLHHRALFGYSAVLILLKLLVLSVSISFPTANLLSSAITPANIISLTNQTRHNLDLPELSTDPKLMQAAQAKAEDMFINDYFAHTSPDGVTPWYWFQAHGYNYRSAGENLAAHFTQAEDVEAGWMASPTHRDNIVSNRYEDIGVGVAQGLFKGYPTTFVVQMFGYELNQVLAQTDPLPAQPVSRLSPTTAPLDTAFIDTSSLVLTPIENGYAVQITMQNITEAALQLGHSRVPFTTTDTPNVWQSVIFYDSQDLSLEGERLYLLANTGGDEQQIVDLASIMPGTDTLGVYTFQDAHAPKLLGVMDVSNLDDKVQKLYVFALLFLVSSLLVAVFVKIEVQRPIMVAHSLSVIALTVLLRII